MKLIPVIEVGYNNQEVSKPFKYPYWSNSEVWDTYHDECFKKAGFTDKFIPYLKGCSFYKLKDISENNLTKLIIDHTHQMREGKCSRDNVFSFFGGYVLQVDGQDKYFPQCCGGLSDISYWEELSNGRSSYYEGHPSPVIKFENNKIVFHFAADYFEEVFEPPPIDTILTIDRLELQIAVKETKQQLYLFQKQLEYINEKEKLYIENIGELLIWGESSFVF